MPIHSKVHNNTFCFYSTIQALQQAEEHLALVTQERSYYTTAVENSKRQVRETFKLADGAFAPPPVNSKFPAASKDIMVHYSFDFAKQVIV